MTACGYGNMASSSCRAPQARTERHNMDMKLTQILQ